MTPALNLLCDITHNNTLILITSAICVLQFAFWLSVGLPSYGIHVGSYMLVYIFYNTHKGTVTRSQTKIWILIALVLSISRLILDPIFMRMDYKVYFYYDSIFQPLARCGLAMCFFTIFIYCSEWLEKWAMKHKTADATVTRFSDASYEVYLTHQFILLAIWEFVPSMHKGVGLVLWAIISFILTLANTWILIRIKKHILRNKTFSLIKK